MTAFQNVTSLTKIVVNAEKLEIFPCIDSENLEELIFNAAPKKFIMFESCKITEFEIPEGVCSVEGFDKNKTVKKLVFPTTLTEIAEDAFSSNVYESLTFKGEYSFGKIENISVEKITYLGAISSEMVFGDVTNIYSPELPEAADGVVYEVSASATEINFAGTEAEFLAAGYVFGGGTTVVNYNVVFDE